MQFVQLVDLASPAAVKLLIPFLKTLRNVMIRIIIGLFLKNFVREVFSLCFATDITSLTVDSSWTKGVPDGHGGGGFGEACLADGIDSAVFRHDKARADNLPKQSIFR